MSRTCSSLPYPQILKEFYTNFGLECDFSLLSKRLQTLVTEQNVNLQMDEIHVQFTVAITGERILGYSYIKLIQKAVANCNPNFKFF